MFLSDNIDRKIPHLRGYKTFFSYETRAKTYLRALDILGRMFDIFFKVDNF